MIERPFLFETTRMIATSWAGRSPTGIDRVCHAYLRHFGSRAQAVVQHRGMFRILSARHSDELFAMLGDADAATRPRIAAFALRAWLEGRSRADGNGAVYLNVSHTDFDLLSHARWVRECRLWPVYFIHDLIPITHARYCSPHAVMRHRGRVVNALKTAGGIVVNSRSTAHELRAFARKQALPLPPLAVAPLAIENAASRKTIDARGAPYFLCLGTVEERKNHRLLFDIWLRLIAEQGDGAPQLVIVGQWGAGSAAVRAIWRRHPALHRHVTLIPRCSDERVRDWIAGAQAVLMPTLAEGFGLPMAEGLAAGTPVIASDLPSFHEIGQGIPRLLDPTDPAAWVDAIAGFGAPGGERQRQLGLLRRYRPPVWDDHFAAVEAWLSDTRGAQPLAPLRLPGGLPRHRPRSAPAIARTMPASGAVGSLPPPLFEAIEPCP
jgi:glycosyltransferase involved in cell wall biosynthesis